MSSRHSERIVTSRCRPSENWHRAAGQPSHRRRGLPTASLARAGHWSGRRGTRLRAQSSPQPPALRSPSVADGVVDLTTGNPDPELLPSIDAALRGLHAGSRLYGEPAELRSLVSFATAEFESDGIPSAAVTVTSGALDAVERVLREHTRTGDRVLVEDPTLPGFLDLLASLELVPHPCSIDEEGLEPDAFDRALTSQVKAAIITPRAQNPTGAAISVRRASDLSRILRRRSHVALIEVDPVGPVSGAAAVTLTDPAPERWVSVKSTSKFLAPDLRVAVMAGDALTIARVERRQALGVRWVSHLLQRLTLALWSDPSSGRRLARAADLYAQRRAALIDALAAHGITAHGRSGFNVWIPVREETATVQAMAERGWGVAAGERFRLRERARHSCHNIGSGAGRCATVRRGLRVGASLTSSGACVSLGSIARLRNWTSGATPLKTLSSSG